MPIEEHWTTWVFNNRHDRSYNQDILTISQQKTLSLVLEKQGNQANRRTLDIKQGYLTIDKGKPILG